MRKKLTILTITSFFVPFILGTFANLINSKPDSLAATQNNAWLIIINAICVVIFFILLIWLFFNLFKKNRLKLIFIIPLAILVASVALTYLFETFFPASSRQFSWLFFMIFLGEMWLIFFSTVAFLALKLATKIRNLLSRYYNKS